MYVINAKGISLMFVAPSVAKINSARGRVNCVCIRLTVQFISTCPTHVINIRGMSLITVVPYMGKFNNNHGNAFVPNLGFWRFVAQLTLSHEGGPWADHMDPGGQHFAFYSPLLGFVPSLDRSTQLVFDDAFRRHTCAGGGAFCFNCAASLGAQFAQ